MRRVLPTLFLAGLVGCAFKPSGLPDDDDGGGDAAIDARTDGGVDIDAPAIDAPAIDAPAIDAPAIDAAIDALVDASIDAPPVVVDIVHVGPADESIGTGDLTISNTLTITTGGTPTASSPLPGGVTLAVVPQDGGGSDLVLLRVRALNIGATGVLRGTGSRPLVILADTVVVSGWIDVAAAGGTPGAGGALAGPGAGVNGGHLHTFSDSGGGGGSFGALGADGGDATCNAECPGTQTLQGGARGNTYGTATLTILEGGSGGGRTHFGGGAACSAGTPGAGGGAVQVYAATSIMIAGGGGITAGGGGGDGGDQCFSPFNFLAGHGGGSGGAIYLQTSTLQNGGALVANGGGGGAGGGDGGDGGDGGSAGRNTAAGMGGTASGMYSAAGGAGSIQSDAADPGGLGPDQGNGGGGGGGLGRIHVRQRVPGALGTSSPTATTSTY